MLTICAPKLMQNICDGLATEGYVLIDDAFNTVFMTEMLNQIIAVDANQFKLAGIGRAADFQTNRQIRSDQILWLDELRSENQNYFNWAEGLRLALNKKLFLGLFEYECMFAHYVVGAFYQKHMDAFKPTENNLSNFNMGSNRKISTILYLNPNWQPEDGGELLMFHDDQDQPFLRVSPKFGRLLVFFSEEFPHEVLPTNKSRYSLTGWFRIKS